MSASRALATTRNKTDPKLIPVHLVEAGHIANKTPTILGCEEQRIPLRITNSHRPTICQPFRSTKHLTSVNLIKVPITETPKVTPLSSTNILPCFLLLNACHISNKTDELSAVVAINKPTVVLVTESWLSEAFPDSAITIGPEFKNFRLDRATAGGGVLAFVHSSIPITRLVTAEVSNKEVLWLLLKPPRTPRPYSSIIVRVVYHPPGQSTENNNDMTEYLTICPDSFLSNRPSSGIVIAGDLIN